MVNGIKNFSEDNLLNSFKRKDEFFELLSGKFTNFKKTPTGVMISPEGIADEIKSLHDLSDEDLAFLLSFILLNDYGIITIPAVSMPGASATIRFDLSTNDAFNLDLNELCNIIVESFDKLEKLSVDDMKSRDIIFGSF